MKRRLISLALACIMLIAIPCFNANFAYAFSENEFALNGNNDVYSLNSHMISVTPVQQSKTYYCGVACAVMAAKALGLGTYSQDKMAKILNTSETSGTSSSGIVNGLNGLLNSAGSSKRYQKKSISNVIINDIVLSINNNVPVFASVKRLPYHTSTSGHFILIVGYYYTDTSGEISSLSATTFAETRGRQIHFNIIDPHYDNQYFGRHVLTWTELYTACSSNNGNIVCKN